MRRRSPGWQVFLFLLLSYPSWPKPNPPLFVDITKASGIDFSHHSGRFGKKFLPETMGSGCAFFDYNNDNWVYLFFVNSKDWPNQGSTSRFCRLYRNNRNGTFTNVSREAGLELELYGMGAAVGDYDNDGWNDLYVSGLGGGKLFHNEAGKFRDVTERSALTSRGFGTSSAWSDFDRDGRLDLFLCNYAKWSLETDKTCSYDQVHKSYCSPADYPPDTPQLFRNLGNGVFVDVSKESGIYSDDCKALGVVTLDYNRDGWPDIFVANDTTPHKLFRNNRNRTFTEVALNTSIALDGNGKTRAGMGVDFSDYDRSGYPSLVIGNFSSEMLSLYHNSRGEFFVDRADTAGIGKDSFFRLTFGCLFLDYDLDGWEDLMTANGHIMDDIHEYDSKLSYAQPALLFHNEGNGQFATIPNERAPDLFVPMVGRGLASADIDNDGDLDVLISQNNGHPRLLRNDCNLRNHWLQIATVGTRSNRNGYGTLLVVRTGKATQTKTVKSSSSYCSQSQNEVTFGLGSEPARVDVLEVHWPNGTKEEYRDLAIDQRITVTEGRGLTIRP
jgi:hypothetical protein